MLGDKKGYYCLFCQHHWVQACLNVWKFPEDIQKNVFGPRASVPYRHINHQKLFFFYHPNATSTTQHFHYHPSPRDATEPLKEGFIKETNLLRERPKMKKISETFTDEEFEGLKKKKGDKNWHDFIMELAKDG